MNARGSCLTMDGCSPPLWCEEHTRHCSRTCICVHFTQWTFLSSTLVQLEIPLESDQSFSEEGSPGNTSRSTALSTDTSLQEEKAADAETPSVAVRTQEPSAATGSNFDFIFNVDAFLKAADARCFVLVPVSLTKIMSSCNVKHGGGNVYFYSLWVLWRLMAIFQRMEIIIFK